MLAPDGSRQPLDEIDVDPKEYTYGSDLANRPL
jgi:hypothetical protein